MNTYPTTPAGVLALGRPVMRAHPELSTAAAELLHTLDALDDDARVAARRYLLHVYGLTVGITTPTSTPLTMTETWAEDRQTVAAAGGVLTALATMLSDSVRDEEPDDVRLVDWADHWGERLLEVARRG